MKTRPVATGLSFRVQAPSHLAVVPTLDTSVRIERVGLEALPVVRRLNRAIFDEVRIINQFDRPDLMILLAVGEGEPVGFKIGYGEDRRIFYSAKGGVLEGWRRRGVARMLLYEMIERARQLGYARFAYDTFPNMHPGMTILGLLEGFRVTGAGYNSNYEDYRVRLEKDI